MNGIGSGTFMGFIGVRHRAKKKEFCSIGLYFIEYTVQYSTVQ